MRRPEVLSLPSVRGGVIEPQHIRNVATAANFAGTNLRATGRRQLRAVCQPLYITIIGIPANADDTSHVAHLFNDMLVTKDRTLDEAARTRAHRR